MIVVTPPTTKQKPPNSSDNLPRRVLRGMVVWLADEGRAINRAFRTPAPYVLVLVTLLLLTLAWQVGFSYKLDPNQDTYLDEPFYHGFNKVEFSRTPTDQLDTTGGRLKPYRWTTGDAYWLFPAVGQHSYHLKLTFAGGINPQPDFVVLANSQKVGAGRAEAGVKTYEFDVSSQIIASDGDLKIELQVQAFTPPKDARTLGVVFFSGEINAAGSDWNLPPVVQLGWLTALVLLAYLLLVRSGFGSWGAVGGAGIVLAMLVWIVIGGSRPWLTVFSATLVWTFSLAYLLLLAADLAMRRVWVDNVARRWVLAIFAGAFAIKLAGLLHPQAAVVDIGFHVNQFKSFWDKGVLLNKIQSQEWGGRYTVYPPTPYAFAGLLRWLIPDEKLLLEFFMVALDSSRVLLVYTLVQKTLADRRAAILSAFFLATMPVGVLSIAWGEVSNLFGEWLLLAILTLVVVKFEQLRKPGYFALTTVLLTLAFISHPGVILLAGTVFLLLAIFLARRKGSRTFALIYLLALALSFGLYHVQTVGDMIPQALDTIQAKFSSPTTAKAKLPDYQVGGSVNDDRLSQQDGLTQKTVHNRREWLLGGLAGFWAEARVYFLVLPILVVPWLLWWLWYSSRKAGPDRADAKIRRGQRRLFWAVVAWFTTAGLFAIIGLSINLYVRYSLFLLPIAALALGVFLAHVGRRGGWWGNLLTVGVSVYFLVTALALYYDRIIYALHPVH